MGGGVHGRGALFEVKPPGLASRVVGVRPYGHRKTKREHEDDVPFVVLAGAHGLGKSLVLERLRAAYRTHTPVALIDCEARRYAEAPAGRADTTWSPVAQALTDLAEQLREPVVQGAGVLLFPRLQAGLLAVSATDWVGGDADRYREEARRILLLTEPRRPWSHLVTQWATKVASRLVADLSGTGPVTQSVIEATLDTLFDQVWSPRRRLKQAADSYREYPGAAGDRRLGLIEIARDFRAGGISRTNAEQWLVRALLADLTHGYAGWWQRSHRIGRPVVLVDNVQSGPGPGLLKAVLTERAEDSADQVAFFASLRGHRHPALPQATVRTLPEVAHSSGWTRNAAPSSGALLVSLPPLTREESHRVVADICAPRTGDADGSPVSVPRELPYAIHRLTAGSPLGVTLLARALRQLGNRDTVSPGILLNAGLRLDGDAEGEAPAAYRQLLNRLVPTSRLEELTVLATAHDNASAHAVAEARLPDSFGAGGVNRLRSTLAEEGLPPADGHFVGDPFLRTLLLLRLHLDDDQHGDHGRWQAVHRTLIRHYTDGPGAADDPVRTRFRLHHELALGETGNAVTYLRDSFGRTDPHGWLETLLFVASAPYYHAHDPHGRDVGAATDHRVAVARALTDHRELPPAGVDAPLHLSVRRVLHAVWQLTDPLVLPSDQVAERLRFDLGHLSDLWPAGSAALWQASREWPDDALAGRPLRVPREGDDQRGNGR